MHHRLKWQWPVENGQLLAVHMYIRRYGLMFVFVAMSVLHCCHGDVVRQCHCWAISFFSSIFFFFFFFRAWSIQ